MLSEMQTKPMKQHLLAVSLYDFTIKYCLHDVHFLVKSLTEQLMQKVCEIIENMQHHT